MIFAVFAIEEQNWIFTVKWRFLKFLLQIYGSQRDIVDAINNLPAYLTWHRHAISMRHKEKANHISNQSEKIYS